MPLVFKTKKDAPEPVDLVGVGLLGAEGRGGRPIKEAAEAGMAELQETNEDGSLRMVPADPDQEDSPEVTVPLEGAALKAAAEDVAERLGIEVVNVKDVNALPAELGIAEDRPPAQQVAEEEAARSTPAEEVNTDPQDMVEGGPDTGVPSPPADDKE